MVSIKQVYSFLTMLDRNGDKGLWLNRIARDSSINKSTVYMVSRWMEERDIITIEKTFKGMKVEKLKGGPRYQHYITENGRQLLKLLNYLEGIKDYKEKHKDDNKK